MTRETYYRPIEGTGGKAASVSIVDIAGRAICRRREFSPLRALDVDSPTDVPRFEPHTDRFSRAAAPDAAGRGQPAAPAPQAIEMAE